MGKLMRALGLMSGTSMDGVDVALIETDGDQDLKRLAHATFAYPDDARTTIAAACQDARTLLAGRDERPGRLSQAETVVTDLHEKAVGAFLAKHGVLRETIDVMGFHGHTVLHRPELRLTVQIGDAGRLARAFAIPVVHDLRAADVAAGGQGAPLAPVYHRALVAKRPERPIAVLNIGGVANVTWIGANGRLIAFDTGPGNALIDDWVREREGASFDENGERAAAGKADEKLVHDALMHPYFAAPPPKSLDRDAFSLGAVRTLSTEDGAATLAALTAEAVARAREHLPEEPKLWLVSGGGRKNRALMSLIAGRVENAVAPAEMAGFDGDSVEAEAWAYLAVRSLLGLPITFPGTTGVREPMAGGVVARPETPE